MTPKEKAKELIDKFKKHSRPLSSGFLVMNEDTTILSAKQCALICVDEIQSFIPYKTYKNTLHPYDGAELSTDYWQEVKQEIEKL